MKRVIKKWLVLLTGWGFLLLGIAGLFLPVLQGILFIVIGLSILSAEYAWAHHLLQKAKARFPTVAHHFENAKEFADRQVSRFRKQSVDSPQ